MPYSQPVSVDLVGEPGRRQAALQVVEDRVVDVDLEGLDHASSGRVPGHSSRIELRLVAADRRAVHEHVPHAGRLLGGEALAVGREVAHAPRRAGPDRSRIEHAHVGPVALAEVAAPHEAEHVGRLAGELPHRLLDRHDLALAHPGAQQVGGQRRIAQLVDVRARVGEAERHVVVREQVGDGVDVVVGDVRAEARARDPRRRPTRTSRRAGRTPRSSARSLTRRPSSSGNRSDSETSKVSHRGFIGDSSRSAAARARHSGSRYAASAHVAIALHQLAEHRAGVEAVRVGHRELHRERPRRDLRPHLRAPRERLLVQRKRFEVLAARRREQRVGERPPDARLPLVHVGVACTAGRA